jgi:hypothetical protein
MECSRPRKSFLNLWRENFKRSFLWHYSALLYIKCILNSYFTCRLLLDLWASDFIILFLIRQTTLNIFPFFVSQFLNAMQISRNVDIVFTVDQRTSAVVSICVIWYISHLRMHEYRNNMNHSSTEHWTCAASSLSTYKSWHCIGYSGKCVCVHMSATSFVFCKSISSKFNPNYRRVFHNVWISRKRLKPASCP